jgi:hypothetical protein
MVCRQVQQGDTVNTGLGGNNILQRFKLNGQAALITGATCAAHGRQSSMRATLSNLLVGQYVPPPSNWQHMNDESGCGC